MQFDQKTDIFLHAIYQLRGPIWYSWFLPNLQNKLFAKASHVQYQSMLDLGNAGPACKNSLNATSLKPSTPRRELRYGLRFSSLLVFLDLCLSYQSCCSLPCMYTIVLLLLQCIFCSFHFYMSTLFVDIVCCSSFTDISALLQRGSKHSKKRYYMSY